MEALAKHGMVYGGGHETYGQDLAGGSFWHSLGNDFKTAGHWMGHHLGEVAGGIALGAAQFIPGVDVAVDTAEAAEAAEAFEAGEEGATAVGKSGTKYARQLTEDGAKYTKRVKSLPKTASRLSSAGKQGLGFSVLGDATSGRLLTTGAAPSAPPPPSSGGPPPNLVGEFSAASGNPYLN
eukprot:COSAG01_NODE_17103_length_1178_cov_1.866543_1_plen_180_part_00